jgi:hypothetical protein
MRMPRNRASVAVFLRRQTAEALMRILIDTAGIAPLIVHDGSQPTVVFVGTLVLPFAIGATLSGAVFIPTEDH